METRAPRIGVVLANHFDEHAPLAIRALDAGLHVLSETVACSSAAEGAALIRAVERSGPVYQLVENYAYKPPRSCWSAPRPARS